MSQQTTRTLTDEQWRTIDSALWRAADALGEIIEYDTGADPRTTANRQADIDAFEALSDALTRGSAPTEPRYRARLEDRHGDRWSITTATVEQAVGIAATQGARIVKLAEERA